MAAAWQRSEWEAPVSAVPSSRPSTCRKELQTRGAERGLPPIPPRPRLHAPQSVLGFAAAYSAPTLGPDRSPGLLQVLPVCPTTPLTLRPLLLDASPHSSCP